MNIIELAKQAGLQTDNAGVWVDDGYIDDQLEALCKLAVAHEREACAKVADEYANGLERNYSEIIADLIRARGEA